MKKRYLCGILAAVFILPLVLRAKNEDGDKFVRLMSAQSARVYEEYGKTMRRCDGPARFLHNDTWLICDTAIWNVDEQIIYAMGNVRIEQENTEITSDKLTYYAERNVAEFRGTLVQLQDKDHNVLRTRNLDYNTKDSVAVFFNGAAMRDGSGQLIESRDGDYDSKVKQFRFRNEVNMFTDSVFISTSLLNYDGNTSVATYPQSLDAWKEDKMISAMDGWYDRKHEKFFFHDKVHMMSPTQEGWSDSLYVDRDPVMMDMLGNAQLDDTEKGVYSLAGRILYQDTLSRVRMTQDPLVQLLTEEEQDNGTVKRDTVYFRADTLYYWSFKRCNVDSLTVVEAESRLNELSTDPVSNIRAKAAEEAAKRLKEAQENDPNRPPEIPAPANAEASAPANEPAPAPERTPAPAKVPTSARTPALAPAAQADSLATQTDSLATQKDSLAIMSDSLAVKSDSLAVKSDSLAVKADSLTAPIAPLDTTKIGFLKAVKNVKMLRSDMQMVCDSLLYSDLDSLARLFKDPIVWNQKTHQYNADSIYVAVKDGSIARAHLLSNAFVHINEDNIHYDQIKSAEMTAFFDEDSQLKRFDALGGASALFFLKEKETIATANRKEAKILSVDFEGGEVSQITYFETPKSDAYPVAQMTKDDQFLKGYNWKPELRPRTREELSARTRRESQRDQYNDHPKSTFPNTAKYFPGYMEKIYAEIARAEKLRKEREAAAAQPSAPDTTSKAPADSAVLADTVKTDVLTKEVKDTLAVMDSLAGIKAAKDSVVVAPKDSLSTVADSLSALKDTAVVAGPTKKEIRQKQREERRALAEKKRQERLAARDKRWAELDALDSLKQAQKFARIEEKRKKKEIAEFNRMLKQKQKEDAIIERYRKKYLKKYGSLK